MLKRVPQGKLQRKKAQLPFRMREVGSWNHTSLLNSVLKIEESFWLENKERNSLYPIHFSTQSLPILWHSESLENHVLGKKNERNYDLLSFDFILQELEPLYFDFFGKGSFFRVLLTRLPSNQKILPHFDYHESLMRVRRTHLPLQVNSQTFFSVEKEEFFHEPGKIYELNNAKIHGVTNSGSKARINLIIDYLPEEKYLV